MANEFAKFLLDRGVRSKCELCDANAWSLPEDANTLMVQLPTYYAGTGLMTGIPAPATGIPVFAAVCTNCGNVRFHAAAVVEPRKPTRRPGPPRMAPGGTR